MKLVFDIEAFVRRYVTKREESLLADDFRAYGTAMHQLIDGKRMLVIGGAGTIGSNYVKAALKFRPKAMYVVDIDENAMTELTRDLRSSGSYNIPDEYITEPIDLGSALFEKFFAAHGPFDIVANFAARKHVRAERDIYSIEAMCETNVFMAKKLLDLLVQNPPEAFFCVSTDKAANPVNVMGATKKLMEETIMAYADRLPIKTARFANVAFSNGSLPFGWINRILKRQPIPCPLGVRRFFVSPVESGELCLIASILAKSGDIVYPKLNSNTDMISFDSFLPDFLREVGCEGWDVRYSDADTSGEKPYEEFFTASDMRDEKTFINLGVVRNTHARTIAEVERVFADLKSVFNRPGATKADVVAALSAIMPDFRHIEKGKSLDARI